MLISFVPPPEIRCPSMEGNSEWIRHSLLEKQDLIPKTSSKLTALYSGNTDIQERKGLWAPFACLPHLESHMLVMKKKGRYL